MDQHVGKQPSSEKIFGAVFVKFLEKLGRPKLFFWLVKFDQNFIAVSSNGVNLSEISNCNLRVCYLFKLWGKNTFLYSRDKRKYIRKLKFKKTERKYSQLNINVILVVK